jgi:hypothetical protein
MGEFCSIRIALINRDLRDIVDCVDLFPFLNHKGTRYTKQGPPLRRNYVCPAFNPPDIQSFLRFAPLNFYPVKPYRLTGTEGQGTVFNRGALRGFMVYGKQRGILKITRFFKGITDSLISDNTNCKE